MNGSLGFFPPGSLPDKADTEAVPTAFFNARLISPLASGAAAVAHSAMTAASFGLALTAVKTIWPTSFGPAEAA